VAGGADGASDRLAEKEQPRTCRAPIWHVAMPFPLSLRRPLPCPDSARTRHMHTASRHDTLRDTQTIAGRRGTRATVSVVRASVSTVHRPHPTAHRTGHARAGGGPRIHTLITLRAHRTLHCLVARYGPKRKRILLRGGPLLRHVGLRHTCGRRGATRASKSAESISRRRR
jgi:hypothetical protein